MNRNKPFKAQQTPQQQFRFNKVNTAPQPTQQTSQTSPDLNGKRKLDSPNNFAPTNGEAILKKFKQEDQLQNENVPTNGNSVQNDQNKRHLQILNDLTTYHKVKVKYDVVSESGPQHAKIFQVKCTIYDPKTDSDLETYASNGSSINKAKQSAAEIALAQTRLEKPTSEQMRKKKAVKIQASSTSLEESAPQQQVKSQTNGKRPKKVNEQAATQQPPLSPSTPSNRSTQLTSYEIDNLKLNRQYIFKRHNELQPDKKHLELINFMLKRIEFSLRTMSDKFQTERLNELEDPAAVEDKEKYRHLKGVFRVGYFGKGIFLKTDRNIDLIVTLSKRPDYLTCKKILDELQATTPELFVKTEPATTETTDTKSTPELFAAENLILDFNSDHLKTHACVYLNYLEYKFSLFFTCQNMDEVEETEPENNFYLPMDKLTLLNARLDNQKWFDQKLKPISNCLLVLRVLRDFCSKDADWSALSDTLLESLVHKCFVNKKFEDVTYKFRQFFEVCASGILLMPKLELTCKYLSDTDTDMFELNGLDLSVEVSETLTRSAQEAVRLVVFNKINVLLKMESLNDENDENEDELVMDENAMEN